MPFLQLEVWNAIAQQAAYAVIFFEKRHIMPGTRQLLGSCHARRPGADDRHPFSGLDLRPARQHPPFGPCAVDDGVLDRFDSHRVGIDVEHTGRFARGGADAARELGEVVGRIQHRKSTLPVAAIHQIIEIRNDVVDRAPVVAERRAAIHASCALLLGLAVVQADDEFLVVLDAFGHGGIGLLDTLKLHEAGDFTHDVLSCVLCRSGR